MSNAHWAAPWTKQPTLFEARVAHTVFHSASVVGAFRLYLSKRSWLIHSEPE